MDTIPRTYWKEEDARALSDVVLNLGRQLGVIFIDPGGVITGWSEGCRYLVGYEAHEVLGRHISLIFTPDDQERKLDEHELTTARELGVAEDERWHVRKDGSHFWASGITLPVPGDGGIRGYIKTFKDASHLRSRIKTLENEVQQAVASTADRHFFLASIAHELRNPLAPLKSVAKLLALQDQLGQGERLGKIIDRQLGFLERLVEDLVDLARVEGGKMQIEYDTVELQVVLRQAVEATSDKAQAAGVALHELLPPVPIEVEIDRDRVHQVVTNLLNNAIKFTPPGGSVALVATVDQTHLLVHVRDTGRGIDAELLPRIFDMFTQADNARSRRGDGLGVGLALVKEIVALHHGNVEVRSEGEGKGSEFTVRLPLRRAIPPAPPQ